MLKILNRYAIHLVAVLLILLMAVSTLLSVYNRQVMLDTVALKAQVEQIRQKTQSLHHQGVKSSDLTVRAFAVGRDEKMLQIDYVKKITKANFDTLEGLLKARKYDLKGFYQVKDTILAYYRFQDYMIGLIRKDSMDAFRKLFVLDKGNAVWAFYNQFATKLFLQESKLFTQAQQDYEAAMNRTVLLQFLLLGVGFPTLLFVMYRLNKDSSNRKRLLSEFSESNKQYLFDTGMAGDIRNGRQIIQHSIRNLEKAAAFINHITAGNYDAHWEGLNEDNQHLNQRNLAGALRTMQTQLKKAKIEDERRLSSNE
jgi:hypothetical protein